MKHMTLAFVKNVTGLAPIKWDINFVDKFGYIMLTRTDKRIRRVLELKKIGDNLYEDTLYGTQYFEVK